MRAPAIALGVLLIAACGGGSTPVASHTPTPVAGALSEGLIAYASSGGIGVFDPLSGKTAPVVALPPGAFRVAGPVWGPAPGIGYPVIYFALHDDRPMESRNTSGVIPYDWVFRADPFTGDLVALGAQPDFESEGAIGLAANAHYLAFTVGCCTDYEVDVLDLTRPNAQVKVLTSPPDQPALFTEGAAPGVNGLIAVRGAATGAWYFLNPTLGVLNKFPLAPGQDDGPIAFNATGDHAAVSLFQGGPLIEPVNLAPILESPSPEGSASGSPAKTSPAVTATASASPSASAEAPHRVNSKLLHVDALAWSPDSTKIALAVNGMIQVYRAEGKDGDAALGQYPAGGQVTSLDWSSAMFDRSIADVKATPKPQAYVDALLNSTKLPAAADTSQNRPLTLIYVWAFDSNKPSPIASITDATPAILDKYPPLAAMVNYHHWTAQAAWPLMGGCVRYRVVITGSIPPVASTFGLESNTPCNAPPSPSPSSSGSPSAKAS
jgi:hypothetical protein